MSAFKKPNILWLSDIHFGAYEKWVDSAIRPEKIITNYFDTLIAKINEVNYTHLLIGGDLAMSGSADDYKDLFDKFLSKIKDNNPHLRIITVIGNHDIDQSKMQGRGANKFFNLLDESKNRTQTINEQFEKKSSYKLKDSMKNPLLALSDGYRKFVKEFVLPTIKKPNIDLFGYEESEGLVGIVYDKDYNLIFNCLNTSWYAFGKKNIISLADKYKKSKDTQELIEYTSNKFEFGKLEVGSVVQIIEKLEEYKRLGIYDESCVITMMHHPLSWLSYELQYLKGDKEFQKLLEKSDIVLTGHQHVMYSEPTIYKGKSYFFEASQLFDYHFYFDKDYTDFHLGYYIFTISHEKEVFTSSYHKMKYELQDKINGTEDELLFEKAKTSEFRFLFQKTETKPKRFKSRKSVFSCFKDFDDCKDYFEERIKIFKGIGALLEKQDGINFCLEKSFKVIFSKLNPEIEVDKVGGLYSMKLENKLFLLQQEMKIKPEDFINQIFVSLNTNLLCKDEGISLIQILIPDFWLLAFFDEVFKGKTKKTDAFELIDDTFTIIRTKLFSPENLKSNDHLNNKELSFEVINLEKYRNS